MSWALVALLVVWIVVAGYLALLPDLPSGVFGQELAHALISMIVVFGAGCLVLQKPRRFVRLVTGGVSVGVLVEMAQFLHGKGRSSEFADVVSDTVGVLVGAVFAVGALRFGRRVAGAVGLLVVALSLFAVLAGPVRASAPVERWLACRNFDVQPSATERVFSAFGKEHLYSAGGKPRSLEQGADRLSDPDLSDLLDGVRCSESFRVTVEFQSANDRQAGPRRILSVSKGTAPDEQNLVIGQSGKDLVFRIKFRRDEFEAFTVKDAVLQKTVQRVVVDYDRGTVRVMINGELRLEERPGGATLANWNRAFPLNLGNELTGDRPFEGTIHTMTFRVTRAA